VREQRARLPEADATTAVSPEARVCFDLHVDPAGRIMGADYRAWGCHHTHRACRWLCAELPRRPVEELLAAGPRAWARELAIPTDRLGRLLVVEEALGKAVESAKTPAQAKT
jgi:hypothetical protein